MKEISHFGDAGLSKGSKTFIEGTTMGKGVKNTDVDMNDMTACEDISQSEVGVATSETDGGFMSCAHFTGDQHTDSNSQNHETIHRIQVVAHASPSVKCHQQVEHVSPPNVKGHQQVEHVSPPNVKGHQQMVHVSTLKNGNDDIILNQRTFKDSNPNDSLQKFVYSEYKMFHHLENLPSHKINSLNLQQEKVLSDEDHKVDHQKMCVLSHKNENDRGLNNLSSQCSNSQTHPEQTHCDTITVHLNSVDSQIRVKREFDEHSDLLAEVIQGVYKSGSGLLSLDDSPATCATEDDSPATCATGDDSPATCATEDDSPATCATGDDSPATCATEYTEVKIEEAITEVVTCPQYCEKWMVIDGEVKHEPM